MFRHISLIIALVFCSTIFAQNTVNNPYSYFGLGLYENNRNALQLALGGGGIALIDSSYNNPVNNATIAYLSKGQPIFNVEVTGRISLYQSDLASSSTRITYLRGIQFSIPFANRFGLGFGYRPVFSKGYRFSEPQLLAGDSLNRIYQGDGGVQQAYLAFALAPIKNENTFLSIGLETNFNFGDATDVRAIEFSAFSENNAANVLNDRIRGFGFGLSMAFKHQFSEKLFFSLGANYGLSSNWNATHTDVINRYAGNFGTTHQYTETISSSGQLKGNISTPSVLGLGFGLVIHPQGFDLNAKKQSRIRVYGDLEMHTWSNYKRTINNVLDTTFNYQNTTAYRLGIEFTPHAVTSDRGPGTLYLSKISYRAGLNLNQIALPTGNLNDFGITFGFGFPLPFDNSQSSINFGMRVGQIGSAGVGSIQERYIAYQIGIVLTPAKWERWFRKIKYD
jgi:hypothetical protein